MLAAFTLWWRELVRFYRQPNRVIGALLTPLILWVLIGSGLSGSFQAPGYPGGYLAYFFPGMIVLILLFTSIFSSFSIIEDRNEGFLQSVLVAPVGRGSVVLGKVAGGTTLAVMQAGIFLALGPTVGVKPALAQVPLVAGLLALTAFGLTAMGFWISWRMDSIQGFHAVMNIFLMPMWLLSGAFFPSAGAPGWLEVVMAVNPLSYGVTALREALGGRCPDGFGVALLAGFAALMFAGACAAAQKSVKADLR